MLRHMLVPALVIGSLSSAACKKEEETKTESAPEATEAAKPGTIMLALDGAMGSIAFQGQGTSLTSEWFDTHCKNEGGGTKDEFQGQIDIMWGCLLTAETDGPDTPRGGLSRVKALACSTEIAMEDGSLTVDGELHDITISIEPPCWTEQFSEMVKEEMPTQINEETGYVSSSIPVAIHDTIPAALGDDEKWDYAYEIKFSEAFGGEADTGDYTLLTKFSDEMIAGQVLSGTGEDAENFAMSIHFHGGAEDLADFRYEGRFPYGEFGDGSMGSRHMRVIAGGPYAGDGTFSAITSGEGFQAEIFESSGGRVMTFKATEDGLHTKTWTVDSAGAISGTPSTTWGGAAGTTEPTAFTYEATAAEISSFLKPGLGDDFMLGEDWHAANGPLDFESVTIDGQ